MATKDTSSTKKTTAKTAETKSTTVKAAAKTAATKTTAQKTAATAMTTTKVATKTELKTTVATKSVATSKSAVKSTVTKTPAKTAAKSQKQSAPAVYDEDSIQHLEGLEHIRLRPGMYIGSLGDGSNENDGIYILLKEGIDNSIDEFTQGFGKRIDIEINNGRVKIRDYGRGIPLGKLDDCVSNVNTGAKYNTNVFKQAIGMNGVGIKATNALSSYFRAASIRDGKMAVVEYKKGEKAAQPKLDSLFL